MCTLLATGFIILTRLNPDRAMRQFVIVAAAAVITWIIPFIIDRVWQLVTFAWVYGILRLVLFGSGLRHRKYFLRRTAFPVLRWIYGTAV